MIRNYTDEQLTEAIKKAHSYKDATRILGFKTPPPNGDSPSYRSVRHRAKRLKLDISHFCKPHELKTSTQEIPLSKILVEHSTYENTSRVKNRIWKAGLLKRECNSCRQIPFWNGKNLTLQLDHKNGVRSDNRIENLQILCPNCHSQTDNYAAKNRIKKLGSVVEPG